MSIAKTSIAWLALCTTATTLGCGGDIATECTQDWHGMERKLHANGIAIEDLDSIATVEMARVDSEPPSDRFLETYAFCHLPTDSCIAREGREFRGELGLDGSAAWGCVAAHVNPDKVVEISLRGTDVDVEPSEYTEFTYHEGAFWRSPGGALQACIEEGPTSDRPCSNGLCPPITPVGRCERVCTGYRDFIGWQRCRDVPVINVWLRPQS